MKTTTTTPTTTPAEETAVLKEKSLPVWLTGGFIPLVQLILAFVLASLLVLLIGEDPLQTLKVLFQGAFITPGGFAFTLYYATSLIFTGLAVMPVSSISSRHMACSGLSPFFR